MITKQRFVTAHEIKNKQEPIRLVKDLKSQHHTVKIFVSAGRVWREKHPD